MGTKPFTRYIAEFMGTFCLVLSGCGAAVVSGGGVAGAPIAGIGLLGVSLAFGLAVVAMAYTVGPVSGCHINPAVSVVMLAAGKLGPRDCLGYVLAQCAGAVAASSVLYAICTGRPGFAMGEYALGANGWGEAYLGRYPMASAFLSEAVSTFLFLTVIFGTTAERANPSMAGLAIGLSLTLVHLVSVPITGTSVNPARSLGPALLAGGLALKQLWLFFVAPITGGLLAAVFWRAVMGRDEAITKKTVEVHEDISINRL